MISEHPSDVKFEIGHVLFLDIVGYSKLLIAEQTERLQTLKATVRRTEQFRLADAEGSLLRLPPAAVWLSFFGQVRKLRFCVRWKLAGRCRVIPNYRCARGFTAAL
jgi:hypothetical protein